MLFLGTLQLLQAALALEVISWLLEMYGFQHERMDPLPTDSIRSGGMAYKDYYMARTVLRIPPLIFLLHTRKS